MTMKTRSTVLITSLFVALLAAPTTAANMVVEHPTGDMHIKLSVPIVDNVNHHAPITRGRIEIAPAEGVPVSGGRYFVLAAANLWFEDFRIDRSPFADDSYRQIGVSLAHAVPFVAQQTTPGVYTFSVPKEDVLIFGGALIDGDPRVGNDRPSQPVTGTIDLNAGTFHAVVVVPKHMGVDWCWPLDCSIDGTLTITVSGPLGPDKDGDGVRDSRDNCRLVANADQAPVTSPVVTPPADLTLASCRDAHLGTASASDVCDALPVTLSHNAPSQFPAGLTHVTWTGRTPADRVATATQRVTVVDTTAPRFLSVPDPIIVAACGPVALGLPVAVDDCGFGPPSVTNNAPASFPPGSTLVTWTATDAAGNRATATQLVTVNDSLPPAFTFVPPAVTITKCVAADFGQAQATDACGVTVTNDAPAKFPLDQTTVVTWRARDGAGNVTTATQNVHAELDDDASCCPASTKIKVGGSGRDTLTGTSGSDCIIGRGGDDVIEALGGRDFVSGGQGRDVLNGGFGDDLVYGRDGDDVIEGGPGDDKLDGGPGTDTCAGATGDNIIVGCEVASGGQTP
jgi:hypothetical protein